MSAVSLTWSPVAGATLYTVYRSTTQFQRGQSVGSTTLTSLTDSTVANSTTYWYSVSASNIAGESPWSLQVDVTTPDITPPATPQTITSFTVSPSSITLGASVTVTWATADATAVRLNGAPVAASGTITESPAASKSYTLVASGAVADISQTKSVSVIPVAQSITSFTATPNSITAGQSTDVVWTTANTTGVTLNGVSVPANSHVIETPPTTKSYTLIASGSAPDVSQALTVTVAPVPPVTPQTITSFTVLPAAITSGQTVTATWATANATVVKLNNVVVANSGSTPDSPTANKSYTLLVSGSVADISQTKSVTVTQPAQTIASFTATPSTITAGQSTTIAWSTTNSTLVRLNGSVVAASSSTTDSPNSNKTYTLVVSGSVPNISQVIGVVVNPAPTPPQTITSFTASPSSIFAGVGSTLTWVTANATGATINGASVGTNGNLVVTPAVTTLYTLVVTGSAAPISSPVTVTVTPGTPSADADFLARRTSPGVIRWLSFDTTADLGGTAVHYDDPVHEQGVVRLNGVVTPWNWPIIDNVVKASGTGSQRQTIPGTDIVFDNEELPGGTWGANFTPSIDGFPNPYIPFGANSQFYVQVKVRWNQSMVDRIFMKTDGTHVGTGVKLFDVVAGDHNGMVYDTSSESKIVIATYYQSKAVMAYTYDPGASNNNLFSKLPGDYGIQQGDYPACTFVALGDPPVTIIPQCFTVPPDEWVTYQLGVTLGAPGTVNWAAYGMRNVWLNSTVKVWVTPESTGITTLVINWTPSTPAYLPLLRWAATPPDTGDQKYGRVNLFAHLTGVGGPQPPPSVPDSQIYYDELIISSQRIPDPGSTVTPPTPPPSWMTGHAIHEWFQIPGTTCAGSPGDPTGGGLGIYANSNLRSKYSGMAIRENKIIQAAGGGHTNYSGNEVVSIDLGVDSPVWVMNKVKSSPLPINIPYAIDGAPVSRHLYADCTWSGSANRVMLLRCRAYATSAGSFNTADGFSLDNNTWDAAGTWADNSALASAACQDSNGAIWGRGTGGLWKWTPQTDTWTQTGAFAEDGVDDSAPIAYDSYRDQLFSLCWGAGIGGGPAVLNAFRYSVGGTVRTAITFNASTALTEFIAQANNNALAGMVYDPANDRYLFLGNGHISVPFVQYVFVIAPNSTAVWDMSILTTTGVALTGDINAGPYSRFQYMPLLNGVVYYARGDQPILFMRTS